MSDFNSPEFEQCVRDGLSDNAIDMNTVAWGANSIKRQVIASCKAHFQEALTNTEPYPYRDAQAQHDRNVWGEDVYKQREIASVPSMSPGEVAGAIISASKFGHQEQIKIDSGNVEDIFKALGQSEQLQSEYGDKFAELMARPKLYFDGVYQDDLQRLAVEHLQGASNGALAQYVTDAKQNLGLIADGTNPDLGLVKSNG